MTRAARFSRNVLLVSAMVMSSQAWGQTLAPAPDRFTTAFLSIRDAYLVVSATGTCDFKVKDDLFQTKFAEAALKAGVVDSPDQLKAFVESMKPMIGAELKKPENLGTNPSKDTLDRWCARMKAEAAKQGVLLPPPAAAANNQSGTPAQAAPKAAPSAPARATIADLDAADKALTELWTRLPFQTRNVMFTSERANGFGVYKQRPSNVFAPGEDMLTYLEPVGYGWKTLGPDTFGFGMVTDAEILQSDRTVLGGNKAFSKVDLTSHHRNREMFITLTMSVKDIEPGNYILAYTLHDAADTNRTTRFEQPFIVKATK